MKIYCDMDGVLADLTGGIKKTSKNSLNSELIIELLSMDFSWRKTHPDPLLNSALDELKFMIGENSEFWANLDMMPDAHVLWDYISQFDVDVLSHPWDDDSAEGKEFWVCNNLEPRPNKIYLPLDGNKHLWATQPDGTPNILIDDFEKYITKWTSAGGIAITHTSAEKTILDLKKILNGDNK